MYISKCRRARRYTVFLVLALIAMIIGAIVSALRTGGRDGQRVDHAALLREVCSNVDDSYTWLRSAILNNHRLRVKNPSLQHDREANGVYHSLIGVDAELAAAYEICRRVREK
jgi:hypothetical protein